MTIITTNYAHRIIDTLGNERTAFDAGWHEETESFAYRWTENGRSFVLLGCESYPDAERMIIRKDAGSTTNALRASVELEQFIAEMAERLEQDAEHEEIEPNAPERDHYEDR